MIKVKLVLNSPPETKEFYAQQNYESDGQMVYWQLENDDILSYPARRVDEIVEKEVE